MFTELEHRPVLRRRSPQHPAVPDYKGSHREHRIYRVEILKLQRQPNYEHLSVCNVKHIADESCISLLPVFALLPVIRISLFFIFFPPYEKN